MTSSTISINSFDHAQVKKIIAWSFYDWASGAFPIIITTFVFATYFTTQVATNEIVGTYQWANATAIAGIIIAIFSPLFGAIADHGGHHKRWLMLFTYICVFFTGLLWFVFPEKSSVFFALSCIIAATVSLEIGIVFYNSFLPHIAPKDYIGRISGWAWGGGYVGGVIALSLTLFVFIKGHVSWLDTHTAEQVRICGPFVAAWFAFFSLPLFISIPDTASTGASAGTAIKNGLRELLKTLKQLPQQKNLVLFLLAHLIYVDGLNTLFAFGGIYAAGTFGMKLSEVILLGITMNVSAGIGAILLAWVDDFLGSKSTILLSLVCLILFGTPLLFVHSTQLFWAIALFLSAFIGPVQAASRSLMARISPPNKTTEMFGLYAFSGRITAFVGPWLLGLMTYLFHSQRAGMATVIVFFIFGTILMLKVDEKS